MIWLPLFLAVAFVLSRLDARNARRERDGAREVALQAKQGWDTALERETNAVVRALALEIERDLWKKAAQDAMDRELKLLERDKV